MGQPKFIDLLQLKSIQDLCMKNLIVRIGRVVDLK